RIGLAPLDPVDVDPRGERMGGVLADEQLGHPPAAPPSDLRSGVGHVIDPARLHGDARPRPGQHAGDAGFQAHRPSSSSRPASASRFSNSATLDATSPCSLVRTIASITATAARRRTDSLSEPSNASKIATALVAIRTSPPIVSAKI